MKLKGPLFVWLTVVRASIASEIQRLIVPIAALTSQVDRGQQGLYGSNWRRGKRQRLQTLSRSSHTDTLENYKIWRPMDYVGKTVGHKAMYLVDVALGNNSQSFRLLVDTGSNSLVIPGKMCRSRTCMFRHLFDASNSTRTNTTMSIQYGLGTLKGHVVKDEVCLGASSDSLTEVSLLQASHQRQALRWRFHGHGYIPHHEAKSLTTRVCARMSFLVANELSDDFAKLPFDGILGLGLPDSRPGANEFSLIEHLNGAGYEVSSKFTLSFGNFGNSQLTLGNVDSTSLLGGQTLWLPLSKASASNWQFPVLDFTLDGHAQHFGSIEVSVDSGTSLLAADDGIRRWLVQQLHQKIVQLLTTCRCWASSFKTGTRFHCSLQTMLIRELGFKAFWSVSLPSCQVTSSQSMDNALFWVTAFFVASLQHSICRIVRSDSVLLARMSSVM